MPVEERPLALAQAALLRALAGGGSGEPPPGFDPARIQATARLLLDKRLRAAARACPPLRHELGARLPALFADYARSELEGEGAAADAAAFLRWLRAHAGPLPDDLRAAAVELRLRRRPGVAVAWLRLERRLLAGLRLPGMRQSRVVSMGFGRLRSRRTMTSGRRGWVRTLRDS